MFGKNKSRLRNSSIKILWGVGWGTRQQEPYRYRCPVLALGRVSSGPRLPLKVKPGSMGVYWTGSRLTYMAPVANECHEEGLGQTRNLSLGWCLRTRMLLNDMEMSGSKLQLRAMSGSMAPLQPESVMMSDAPVTIDDLGPR